MPRSTPWRSNFVEALGIHLALRSAMRRRLFQHDAVLEKTASKLLRSLESRQTTYGRQLQMLQMMRRGARLEDISRSLHCSRRTVFRYLNHFEEAQVDVRLEGQVYRVRGRLLDSLDE